MLFNFCSNVITLTLFLLCKALSDTWFESCYTNKLALTLSQGHLSGGKRKSLRTAWGTDPCHYRGAFSSWEKWLTVWCKPSPFFHQKKKISFSSLVWWKKLGLFLTQWPNLLILQNALWVWNWKLCKLESRKSVRCSLWSKSLLLPGLLIPHEAAVFNTHSNNAPLLFSDTRLSFICASCLSFVFHPAAVAGKPPLHFSSIFYPRTVAVPRGDVSAKRNHVRDHETSILRLKPRQHVYAWGRRKEVKWGWNYLFVYIVWVSVFICMILSKFPRGLTSDSRRTINLWLFVKTIFWTWTHIGLWNVNVIACNSSHLLSS